MIHTKKYKNDTPAVRKMTEYITQRAKLFRYLLKTDYHRYRHICAEYGIPEVLPKNAFHSKKMGMKENSWRGKYH